MWADEEVSYGICPRRYYLDTDVGRWKYYGRYQTQMWADEGFMVVSRHRCWQMKVFCQVLSTDVGR